MGRYVHYFCENLMIHRDNYVAEQHVLLYCFLNQRPDMISPPKGQKGTGKKRDPAAQRGFNLHTISCSFELKVWTAKLAPATGTPNSAIHTVVQGGLPWVPWLGKTSDRMFVQILFSLGPGRIAESWVQHSSLAE